MIEVKNLTTSPLKGEFMAKIAEKVLENENRAEENLSVALVGQGRIRALNKRYRGKNRTTDVLAFAESEIPNSPEWQIPKNIRALGEIVICPREVKKNAKRQETTFEKELARVLIHGILHLLGYDHGRGEKEAERMREKEDYYLSQASKSGISNPKS